MPPSTARIGYVVYGEVGDDDGGRLAAEGELGSYVEGLETEEPTDGHATEDIDGVVHPPGL
jgi:hypothetical protein